MRDLRRDEVEVIEEGEGGRRPVVLFQHIEEPAESVIGRAALFRAEMTALPDWSDTLVISHWGFIRALTGLRVPNGHLLRFDPHSRVARDLMASDLAPPQGT